MANKDDKSNLFGEDYETELDKLGEELDKSFGKYDTELKLFNQNLDENLRKVDERIKTQNRQRDERINRRSRAINKRLEERTKRIDKKLARRARLNRRHQESNLPNIPDALSDILMPEVIPPRQPTPPRPPREPTPPRSPTFSETQRRPVSETFGEDYNPNPIPSENNSPHTTIEDLVRRTVDADNSLLNSLHSNPLFSNDSITKEKTIKINPPIKLEFPKFTIRFGEDMPVEVKSFLLNNAKTDPEYRHGQFLNEGYNSLDQVIRNHKKKVKQIEQKKEMWNKWAEELDKLIPLLDVNLKEIKINYNNTLKNISILLNAAGVSETNIIIDKDRISFPLKEFYVSFSMSIKGSNKNYEQICATGYLFDKPIMQDQINFIEEQISKFPEYSEEKKEQIQRDFNCRIFKIEGNIHNVTDNITYHPNLSIEESIALEEETGQIYFSQKDTITKSLDLMKDKQYLKTLTKEYHKRKKKRKISSQKKEIKKQDSLFKRIYNRITKK